jgi:hypothetical protein
LKKGCSDTDLRILCSGAYFDLLGILFDAIQITKMDPNPKENIKLSAKPGVNVSIRTIVMAVSRRNEGKICASLTRMIFTFFGLIHLFEIRLWLPLMRSSIVPASRNSPALVRRLHEAAPFSQYL